MQEYFKILGLPVTATDEEIENAYLALKEKYSRERFLEGEKGNEAAKQLTKLETAYHEIMENRKANSSDLNSFVTVEELIKAGNISLAQAKLDDIYAQTSVVYEGCMLSAKETDYKKYKIFFDGCRRNSSLLPDTKTTCYFHGNWAFGISGIR